LPRFRIDYLMQRSVIRSKSPLVTLNEEPADQGN
jgi:hypothetical protein